MTHVHNIVFCLLKNPLYSIDYDVNTGGDKPAERLLVVGRKRALAPPKELLGVRFDAAIVEQIDAEKNRMTILTPGHPATRSDAVRNLVIEALKNREKEKKR